MSLEANSYCPGGSGKKIKYCCADNIVELQKIEKMQHGQQQAACLNYVDSLLSKQPDRVCLIAAKCELLFQKHIKDVYAGQSNDFADWSEIVDTFYNANPENPLALVWKSAQAILNNDIVKSLDFFEESFNHQYPGMNANGMLCALNLQLTYLVNRHMYPCVLFILSRKMDLLSHITYNGKPDPTANPEYNEARNMFHQIQSNASIPLPLRQSYRLYAHSNSSPDAEEPFARATEKAQSNLLREARDAFKAIADAFPTDTHALYNAAVLSMFRSEYDLAIELLKLLSERDTDLAHKVDAFTLARLLSGNPLDDCLEMVNLTYKIKDADAAKERLLTNPQLLIQNQQLSSDEGIPPMLAGVLLDQAKQMRWSEDLTFEDIPVVVGGLLLWGKRTDRDALLEITEILDCDREGITEMLQESLGDLIEGEPDVQTLGAPSVTQDSFTRQQVFPDDIPLEKLSQLQKEHFSDLFMECWPELPLGVLGCSVRDAAANPNKRVAVESVLDIVRFQMVDTESMLNFDQLRQALNLPEREKLSCTPDELAGIPTSMYGWINLKSVSDNDLAAMYNRYNPYGINETMRELAAEIITREELPVDLRMTAWIKLCLKPDGLIEENIAKGKEFCHTHGLTDSYFDLMEVQLCIGNRQFELVDDMMHKIYQDHKGEPKTMQMLMGFVAQLEQLQRMSAAAQAGGVLPGNMGSDSDFIAGNEAAGPQQPSGLWTPDQPNPPAAAPTQEKKSGLWIPD